LAEYLLRHPFALQKITWNATTKTVIYRSKRHHTTKRNFEIFKAPYFIAASLLHLPPKGQQTVRYYGLYSNKCRGQTSPIPSRIIRATMAQIQSLDKSGRICAPSPLSGFKSRFSGEIGSAPVDAKDAGSVIAIPGGRRKSSWTTPLGWWIRVEPHRLIWCHTKVTRNITQIGANESELKRMTQRRKVPLTKPLNPYLSTLTGVLRWRSDLESNQDLRFRKPLFYPLNYRSERASDQL
jgi:hypothetical protein